MFYLLSFFFFFFNDTATTEIYTLSLHDALPNWPAAAGKKPRSGSRESVWPEELRARPGKRPDRKSTRLNSSHSSISYAVFCLKKKNNPISSVGSSNDKKIINGR